MTVLEMPTGFVLREDCVCCIESSDAVIIQENVSTRTMGAKVEKLPVSK